MIEVTLLCNLLALVLNIPHLGCDRPSDPAGFTPVYLGHTVTIIVYYICHYVCYIFGPKKGPASILCYIFVCPNKGPEPLSVTLLASNEGQVILVSLCGVTFLAPKVGLEGLG